MIQENLAEVRRKVQEACARCGRDPGEITLIAVSKTKPASMIQAAIDAGQTVFGENKVQEILEKKPLFGPDIRWHMIGHLQRNKVKQIIGKTDLIHSVDSVRLLDQIEAEASKENLKVSVLLEVNVAKEESKYGFYIEEVEGILEKMPNYSHIIVQGLMTIAPFVTNPVENRGVFQKLKQFSVDMKCKNIDNVNMSVLSMGMTGDYEIAIEEGATMVRVGTGIFGSR